jgi:hypothetical protein
LFGCKDKARCGPNRAEMASTSDSTHPRLYIEAKHYAKQAVRTLWRATALLAAKEKKTAVLVLYEKGKRGGLVVVHEDDLDAMILERVTAQTAAFAPGTAPAVPVGGLNLQIK